MNQSIKDHFDKYSLGYLAWGIIVSFVIGFLFPIFIMAYTESFTQKQDLLDKSFNAAICGKLNTTHNIFAERIECGSGNGGGGIIRKLSVDDIIFMSESFGNERYGYKKWECLSPNKKKRFLKNSVLFSKNLKIVLVLLRRIE